VAHVADRIAQTLVAEGVRHVWGMPGGDTLPVVDAVEAAGLPFVLVRDETSAAFMADASAQLTGRMGACVATLGPGLTNLLTGVAGALLDRAPILALTSRYKTDLHGSYTHMMIDQTGLMQATGKAVFRMTAANASRELRRATAIARAPRPGPVWLEVPTEVASAPAPLPSMAAPPPSRGARTVPADVAAQVAGWTRPVILVGFGGRHASVQELAQALNAPVLTTYKAKGALPETDDGCWVGSAGLAPAVDRVHLEHLAAADGVLLVGWDPVELRDHWMPGWPDAVQTVVLDDHAVTDLPARIDALVTGDIAALVADLTERTRTEPGASTWTPSQRAAWRQAWQGPYDDGEHGPATAVRAIQAACPDSAVVSVDTGAHRITIANTWRSTRPDRLLQNNGLASMGYAVPAAIAASALGHPALALTGDMGVQMVMGELMVAAEHEWPLTVVVFIDDELGLIALKQKRAGLPSRGVRFANPDWAALARAVGGAGVVARGPQAIRQAVADSLARPGVDLIAVPVDESHYLPQIG